MKKAYWKEGVAMLAAGAMLLSACGGTGAQKAPAEGVPADTVSGETAAGSAGTSENSASPSNAADSAVSGESAGKSLIQQFTEGSAMMDVAEDYLPVEGYVDLAFQPGESYSRSDMEAKLLQDTWAEDGEEGATVTSFSYGAIAVPLASGDWYCVKVGMNTNTGEATIYMVLQEQEDTLSLHFAAESLYRTYANVNQYGKAGCGGSGGAASFVDSAYAPDETGAYQLVYTYNVTVPGWGLYEGEKESAVSKAMNELAAELSEDEIPMIGITQAYVNGQYYYVVETEDEKLRSMADEKLKKYNAKVTSMEEVDGMVNARWKELGYTEEMFHDTYDAEMTYTEGDVADNEQWLGEDDPVAIVYDESSEGYKAVEDRTRILGKGVKVPEANGTIRLDSLNSAVTVALEQGEWVCAESEYQDYFHVTETLFQEDLAEGEIGEISLHFSEGMPDMRLHLIYPGSDAVWYCITDGRGDEEDKVSEIYGGEAVPYEPGEYDSFLTAAKVYAGMIVSAGTAEKAQQGLWQQRLLANCMTLILKDSQWQEKDGLRVPKWLMQSYGDVFGYFDREAFEKGLTEESPIRVDGDFFKVEPVRIYEEDTVDLLEVREIGYGLYELSFAVHGQTEEGVLMTVQYVNSPENIFPWVVFNAEMSVG